MANLYTRSEMKNHVDMMENLGYSTAPLSCTKICLGSFLLLAPDDLHDSYKVEEIPRNYGECFYNVRKIRKISQSLRNRLESAQKRIDGFVGYYDYELYQ